MLELRLAGIHEDGEHLVLESADGTSFLLPIDQNLRTSIAKARRIQPVRGRGASNVFGPRDIQARFRQGATVEEIVAESGWDADRVRKYEWPIIAERQHIISAARNARISDMSQRGGTPFQEASLEQRLGRVLSAWRLDGASQDWNTFQQESGQWTVTFEIPLTEQERSALPVQLLLPARWTYNPANQSIYASNDAAYFFMGRTAENASQPASSETVAEEVVAKEPHLDFARHADASTQFPKTESLKAVRVPENKAQDELLEELDARRGTRDFDSASERKLADLLERARRSSAEHLPATVQQTEQPAQNTVVVPEAREEKPLVSENIPAESPVTVDHVPVQQTVVAPISLQEPTASVTTTDQGEVNPSVEEPALEPKDTNSFESSNAESNDTFVSRAERRNHIMQKYLDSQTNSKKAPQVAGSPAVTTTAEEPPVTSERDAAGSSWRSQNQTKPVTTEPVAEETPNHTSDEDQNNKPARSTKPKRASVPSWDDIIFGSQRK